MTRMGKTLAVILGLTALFGATLALRTGPDAPARPARLTPAQMAEVQPASADTPKAKAPAPDPAAGESAPTDLDLEDGSGS